MVPCMSRQLGLFAIQQSTSRDVLRHARPSISWLEHCSNLGALIAAF